MRGGRQVGNWPFRSSTRLAAGLLACMLSAAAPAAGGEPHGGASDAPPSRVVSLNLCTDQLAMLIAAPGQLVAVSYLARDPRASTMPEAALGFDITYGQAEEVFLRQPDLVLAGTYTTRATVELLRRLGVRVEEFPIVESLEDVAGQMRAVGRVLGREPEGERLAAAFEAGLALLRREAARRPRAAIYYANGWTGGRASLAGEILAAAGFENVARSGGFLPLERLLLAAPEVVITGEPYPGASRAEEILVHPALVPLKREGAIADAEWVCGVPGVLQAIARLGALHDGLAR